MDFKDVMKANSDDQLIEIVTKRREDYNPEALLAAEAELKNRGIDISEIINKNQILTENLNTDKYLQPDGILKPNGQRAKVAILLIWIVLALEIVSLISGYLQYDLIQLGVNGSEISDETANTNDTREQLVGILYLIAYVISGVTFILWFRRAYYNLHLKVKNLSHSEGWAAGSWFVPFINLYRPYQIMKELYEETGQLLNTKGIIIEKNLTTNFLGAWWALWILDQVIGQLAFRLSKNAESFDELTFVTATSMIGNIVGIGLAFITIKVIRDYSEVEPMLYNMKNESETFND